MLKRKKITFIMNKRKLLMTMLISLMIVQLAEQNVVTTVQGKIRGIVHEGYTSYMGIPYASVTDSGKFKNAGLAPVWYGVRESHESHCSAVSIEDCLQLDVHVPSSARGHWPVLLWVSGGTGHYNAKQLVQEDIIVVIVHHRVGPLGFLCTDDPKIPGNAAAKDIVLAMRWVQDNIVAFKGNAAKVVIGGQSIGAAIVEALTLSPITNGLYHGAIMQSGTILAPWAFNYDANQRANKLANMLNVDDTTALTNAKLNEIIEQTDKLDVPYIPFGLCIEKSFKNEINLINEAPFDLLVNRKFSNVPMMIGYNSDEAYVFASILKESGLLRSRNNDISVLLPQELKFFNDRERKQMARQVEDLYFKNNINMSSMLVYHRDAYFLNHIYRSAYLHSSSQSVYFYQFSYSSDLGVQEEPSVRKTGAAHSDELAYLFNGRNLQGDDGVVQKNLVKMWTNFVKHFNPAYKETNWEPLDPSHPRLLDIRTELKMIDYPHIKESNMWDDAYKKYYYSRSNRN